MEDLYSVSGVAVSFPFKPYPCQLEYMEKVIRSLQTSCNAVLESPTGTGKTLCLLCATLAWREDLQHSLQLECGGGEGGEGGEGVSPWDTGPQSGSRVNVPKIIYASRTHSQLSQVIGELKNTRYRPKIAIIGSREQLCINPEVSIKETNSEKVHLCRAKVQSHSCSFYNNMDVKRLRVAADAVMDIEDLVMAGSRQSMCPYYLARELKSEADLIFMPYNYILDIKTRQTHGIDIQGSVVILDEAHNIEKVCEDSASFDLTSADVAHCISDVQQVLQVKRDSALVEEGGEDDMQDYLNLKEFFLAVEKSLDGLQLAPSTRTLTKPGHFIFDFFAEAGLSHASCAVFAEQCSKAISFLTSEGKSLFKNGNNIQKFLDAVKVVYSQPAGLDRQSATSHYKVFVKAEENKKKKSDVWTVSATDSSRTENRTLSYWCFSPGRTMADLVAQGVRSIVLTSGTLSPLDSFSSELGIDFPVRYEGPHVISKEQVWVGVVSKGPDGVSLNSSYANRFSTSYQSSLGNTIVNFSRIVPHGLLVFFPSYPVMNGCVEYWRGNGIFQRLEQCKPVFLEPRRKSDFISTMNAFYQKISDPQQNGATFFAVCRGKVSEGLDFADVNGRAVIITGLPYPPRMDPKVTLKMQYLEECRKNSSAKRPPPAAAAGVGLSGEEWYKQQASRAVNQAVGRVIRHRHDFGAIILCDERFGYRSAISQLPQWVRPYVTAYNRFGLVQRDLTLFFKNAERKFAHLASKKLPAAPGVQSGLGKEEGGGGGGGRLPIVIRDVPAGSRHKLMDARTVETHLSSSSSSSQLFPHASLAKLRVENERDRDSRSLLSSLLKCESSPCKQHSTTPGTLSKRGPSFSDSILAASSSSSSSEEAGSRGIRAPSSSRHPAVKRSLTVAKNSSSSSSQQAAKMATVAGFISEIQDSLSNEAFQRFKKALAAYKESRDIYHFAEVLKELFRQPSLFPLLQGMFRFVMKEHQDTYTVFYSELTGRTLKRRQGGAAAAAAAVKRKPGEHEGKEEPRTKRLKTTGPTLDSSSS